ncbi:MAG: rhodanese-like domain-containing protein [Verrucomicrobiales bacterium]|nr:rhodanese-like domain-containing protein [Verrucomicrobiales bacterium]
MINWKLKIYLVAAVLVATAGCERSGGPKNTISYEPYSAEDMLQQVYELDTLQTASLLERNPNLMVVDIRDVEAFSRSRLPNASHYDFQFESFPAEIAAIDSSTPVLVYGSIDGDAGMNTPYAVGEFMKAGFTTIYFYTDGIETWIDQGQSFESDG